MGKELESFKHINDIFGRSKKVSYVSHMFGFLTVITVIWWWKLRLVNFRLILF